MKATTLMKRTKDRNWTLEENNLLMTYYPSMGERYCAEQLGRSISSVRAKVFKLELQRDKSIPREFVKTINEDLIIKEYGEGKTMAEIQNIFNLSYYIVRRVFVKRGITPKKKGHLFGQKEAMMEDYKKGEMSLKEIATKYDTTEGYVSVVRHERGIPENIERRKAVAKQLNLWRGSANNYEMWVSHFGKEEADKRLGKWRRILIDNHKMRACGSNIAWSGWYGVHFFRSLKELTFMLANDDRDILWKSAEYLTIPYTLDGIRRNSYPDFMIGNELIEIKPIKLHDDPEVLAKKEGALIFCKEHGLTYVIKDIEVDVDKVRKAYLENKIKFNKKGRSVLPKCIEDINLL